VGNTCYGARYLKSGFEKISVSAAERFLEDISKLFGTSDYVYSAQIRELYHRPDDGGRKHLRNVGNLYRNPRRSSVDDNRPRIGGVVT
jgi:hypothetical protein